MVRQNGCIDFQHRIIRNGLLAKLGEDASFCHGKLFEYLRSLPAADPLKDTEIVYHAYYSGNGAFIPRHIANVRLCSYFRTVYQMYKLDPKTYPLPDFSMERDYDFLCQQYAADLHTVIMAENAPHLSELVKMLISLPPERNGKDMSPIYWMEFLNKVLPAAFGESDDELRMLYTVFGCILVYATELCKNFTEEPTAKKNLALCHQQLARIASKNRNRDMNEEAVQHIRSYCGLLGELIDESETLHEDQAQEYAESQDLLMTLLLQGSRLEDMPEVLRIGQKLLKLYEELDMPEHTSRVHFNLGMACERSGGMENRENAFQHYMQAIKISMRYAEEKKDSVSITYRILSTLKMGNMCLDVENYSYATQMFYLAHQYAQEAYEKLRDGHSRQYVLMAQEGIGMALIGRGGDSAEQGRQMLIAVLVQSLNLLKEYSNPGLQGMCQRIRKVLGV